MNNSNHNFVDHVPCPYAVSVFFTTILVIISLAAVIGNLLVFVAVYKTPILRTSTNYYYVNMAVSDFLSSITTWPLYLTDEIITSCGSLIQGSLATAGCKIGVYVRTVSTSVSILSLVLIAVDRFIAVVLPLKASLLTRRIRVAMLFAIWSVSMGYCVPMLYFSKVEYIGKETFCRLAWSDTFALIIYYVTGIIIINIAPIIAIVILYSRIMRVLRRNPEYGTESNKAELRRLKQGQNIMKIFKSIVIAYFVCFFLFCVYIVLKMAFPVVFVEDECKLILGFSYFVFPSLSTAINPVILFSFSSNFRQAFQTLCHAFSFAKCWLFCKGRRNNENIHLAELAVSHRRIP